MNILHGDTGNLRKAQSYLNNTYTARANSQLHESASITYPSNS